MTGAAMTGGREAGAAPEPIRVRDAVPDDGPVVVEFNRRLARETEGKELDADAIREGVDRLLRDARLGRYFVAAIGDRVVGQIAVTYEWSDWRNGSIWWLQSVYVAVEHRRRGVFRRLYEHVVAQARAMPDVIGVRLYVERDNGAARATYERLGMSFPGYDVMERLWNAGAAGEGR